MKKSGLLITSKYLLAAMVATSVFAGDAAIAQKRAGLPRARPEAVGFSSERLQKLDAFMQRMVDEKEFAGIVTMASRQGKVFHSKAYGMRDIASGSRMTEDTIFRIFSMSKPITAVAMMILYEEGRWKPEHPISKHIPDFANLKVFKGLDDSGKTLVEEPAHPPTMQELMTHTAGFAYGFEDNPVGKLHRDETGRNVVLVGSGSFKEMIDRIATIPLLCQPGTRWHYSLSVDIQGYLVEKLSGKPFAVFLKEMIFDPLGMRDTAFYLPKEKWNRFATYYWKERSGELVPKRRAPNDRNYDEPPAVPTGGGGLVSTAGDYMKFAQMLLNGGKLGPARILKQKSVKLMTSNHLSESLVRDGTGLRPGFDYGYNVGIFTNPALADCPCGKGTYRWGGSAGTWFWVDPENEIVFVGMVQRLSSTPAMIDLTPKLVYEALKRRN